MSRFPAAGTDVVVLDGEKLAPPIDVALTVVEPPVEKSESLTVTLKVSPADAIQTGKLIAEIDVPPLVPAPLAASTFPATNVGTKKYANKSVVTYIISSTEFSKKVKGVDLIFTSNFFEHLASKEDLIKTIDQIQKALKVKGKLIVLMPNIKYVGHKYWDFVDHQLPLTENAVIEALELNNFKVLEVKSRFLPYTTKSKIPKLDIFVKIYLRIPILQYVLGKQSLVVAEKINRKN